MPAVLTFIQPNLQSIILFVKSLSKGQKTCEVKGTVKNRRLALTTMLGLIHLKKCIKQQETRNLWEGVFCLGSKMILHLWLLSINRQDYHISMFSFDFCLDMFFSPAFKVICGQIFLAGTAWVQVIFNLIRNLFLSTEPNKGLGSATVALIGEHRRRLTRGWARGNGRVCKRPARTYRDVGW